jgi:hypothetical protein
MEEVVEAMEVVDLEAMEVVDLEDEVIMEVEEEVIMEEADTIMEEEVLAQYMFTKMIIILRHIGIDIFHFLDIKLNF